LPHGAAIVGIISANIIKIPDRIIDLAGSTKKFPNNIQKRVKS
jgi:hypothetical protein